MKPQKIENLKNITSLDRLPDVIFFSQMYKVSNNNNTKDVINDIQLVGNYVQDSSSYSIEYGATEKFNKIKNIIEAADSRVSEKMISKTLLENSFTIYELDDFGFQATSYSFTDMIIYLFVDGQKVRQANIGYLRDYLERKVYVLVDVDSSLITEETSVVAIVVSKQKSNVKYSSDILNHENILTDYDIVDSDGKYITTNLYGFGDITLKKKNNEYVSKYFQDFQESNELKSYLSYFPPYLVNSEISDLNKSIDITVDSGVENVNGYISKKLLNDYSDVSNTVSEESLFRNSYFKYNKTTTGGVVVIDSLGNYTNDPNTDRDNSYIEECPDFVDGLKIVIPFTLSEGTTFSLNNVLAAAHIYKWNMISPKVFYFDGDGKLINDIESAGNYTAIVYYNDEEVDASLEADISGITIDTVSGTYTKDRSSNLILSNAFLNSVKPESIEYTDDSEGQQAELVIYPNDMKEFIPYDGEITFNAETHQFTTKGETDTITISKSDFEDSIGSVKTTVTGAYSNIIKTIRTIDSSLVTNGQNRFVYFEKTLENFFVNSSDDNKITISANTKINIDKTFFCKLTDVTDKDVTIKYYDSTGAELEADSYLYKSSNGIIIPFKTNNSAIYFSIDKDIYLFGKVGD